MSDHHVSLSLDGDRVVAVGQPKLTPQQEADILLSQHWATREARQKLDDTLLDAIAEAIR